LLAPPLAQSTMSFGFAGGVEPQPMLDCFKEPLAQDRCAGGGARPPIAFAHGASARFRPYRKTSQSTSAVRMISKTASVLPNTNAQVPNSSTIALLAVARRNSLNLLPEQHSQRRTFGVFSSSLSGDRGKTALGDIPALRASRGPHKTLVLPELRKSIRRQRCISCC
jgi:hypothetical protein